MDDVHKEAQDRGYNDGRNMRMNNPSKYGYTYSGHITAYNRGYNFGRQDYERLEREEYQRSQSSSGEKHDNA